MEEITTGVNQSIVGHIQHSLGNDNDSWLPCDGAVYPINLYPALFAAIGARYGGNGIDSFAVPKINDGTDFEICFDGWFVIPGCPPSEWPSTEDHHEVIQFQVRSHQAAYEAGVNPFGNGIHSKRLDETAMHFQALSLIDAYGRGEDPLERHLHMDELDTEWLANQVRAMQNANEQGINPHELHQHGDTLDSEWLERQVQTMKDAYARGDDPLHRHEHVDQMDDEWLKMQAQVLIDAHNRAEAQAKTKFDGGDAASRPVDPNFRFAREDEVCPKRLAKTVSEMIQYHEEGKGDRAIVDSAEVLEEDEAGKLITCEEANELVNQEYGLKKDQHSKEEAAPPKKKATPQKTAAKKTTTRKPTAKKKTTAPKKATTTAKKTTASATKKKTT